MKKNYVVPRYEIEMFIPENSIAGCYRCLSMNSAKAVYYDLDKDGVLDNSEKVDTNKFTDWDKKNDCYKSGSEDAAAHRVDSFEDADYVIVVDNRGNQFSAYKVDEGQGSDYPHFVNRVSNAS